MPAAKRSNGNSNRIVLEFDHERETKNAVRFSQVLAKGQDRGEVGTLYILKDALSKVGIDAENGIVVTIEEAPEGE